MTRKAKTAILCLATILAAVLGAQAQGGPPALTFDLVIAHGRIVDGTGSPWYSGDVGIRGGRILTIRLASEPSTPREK